jgi:hypothetical protein
MSMSYSGSGEKMIEEMMPNDDDFDQQLAGIGVHREVKYASPHASGPTNFQTRYTRPHRSVDVTSYGDTSPQEIVTSPGLNVAFEGTKRDGKIIGMIFLAEGRRMQIEYLERDLEAKRKESSGYYNQVEARNAMLLTLWDEMGKKKRVSFAAKHPTITALMKELAEKRDKDAYYDSLDNDW